MSNIKPPTTTVVLNDPKAHEKLDRIEADTKAIRERLEANQQQPESRPRYFPVGYFP